MRAGNWEVRYREKVGSMRQRISRSRNWCGRLVFDSPLPESQDVGIGGRPLISVFSMLKLLSWQMLQRVGEAFLGVGGRVGCTKWWSWTGRISRRSGHASEAALWERPPRWSKRKYFNNHWMDSLSLKIHNLPPAAKCFLWHGCRLLVSYSDSSEDWYQLTCTFHLQLFQSVSESCTSVLQTNNGALIPYANCWWRKDDGNLSVDGLNKGNFIRLDSVSSHLLSELPTSTNFPAKVSDRRCNVSCLWRFNGFCVFTCRGAERKRELHVLLKVLLDTPHPTSPCTINFIFGVLSRGSLAKQHDRKTVQNPEAQGGN